LPIAGLISPLPLDQIDIHYKKLESKCGAGNHPFVSADDFIFYELLVIPAIKLGDKGLFDGKNFRFTNLFV
jgi:adenine deaminase